jgi:hypothetical protein
MNVLFLKVTSPIPDSIENACGASCIHNTTRGVFVVIRILSRGQQKHATLSDTFLSTVYIKHSSSLY